MKKIHPFFFLLVLCLNVEAQQMDTCALKIGINLAGPSDYGTEWPFKDIMKNCREWGTQNVVWYGGGQNPWDSQLADSVAVDDDGYPLEMPFEWPGMDTSQVFYTVWANTAALPAGIYVCLYDGVGVIDFNFDASILSQTPGRIEVNVNPGVDNIMQLAIKQSQLGNHIRNIRFLLPGTEYTYKTEPYNSTWLDKLEPFKHLRFMDWGHTNFSKLRHWHQRPTKTNYTYTIHGTPYEEMIAISNFKQADAWVCVPHLADSNYITNMATLFRDSLDPNLTLYVEYSNEIWNWMFDQAHYCNDSLDQSLPWPERLGPKIGEVMEIWTNVFAGQLHRIKRVCGVQIGWMDVAQRTLSAVPSSFIDLASPTSYIGLNGDSLDFYGASLTQEKVFQFAYNSLYDGIEDLHSIYNYALAEGYGGMVYYEGGQHFTPNPFGSVQPYNDTLVATQDDPRMYDLYMEMMDSLRKVTGPDSSVFMTFSFIAPVHGQYGSWGALESQFYQFPPYHQSAPKYQALLDNIYDCEVLTNNELPDLVQKEILVFPNPGNGVVTLKTYSQSEQINIHVMDLSGRTIYVQRELDSEATIDLSKQLPAGCYLLEIEINGRNVIKKYLKH